MKKFGIVISIMVLFAVIGVASYFVFNKPVKQNEVEVNVTHSDCLGEDEVADFLTDKNYSIKYPKFPVTIYVTDKISGKERFHFQIDNVSTGYQSIEIHKCGVYVIRELPGDYKIELWQYNFAGGSKKILTMAEKDAEGKKILVYYSYEFRTDSLEEYSALVKIYSVKPLELAYTIYDIGTSKDIFVLPQSTIFKKNPELDGSLGLEAWTKSGGYFWGDIFAGAPRLGFVRIQRNTWKYDVLPAPGGTLGGTAFNPEYGYVTYNTGPGWIGIDIVTEQVHNEWRKAGKIVELYVYNLFTKEKNLLATSTEPSWNGKPQWLSNTELQYEMPNGEKKIYKINEK
ncbi:MAG: hypothetical protein A3G49_05895 [Candidatus Sungbacteria bacterium RIFCSPLOWO2_12_FULL_41_11]|uniref:Uncharacterized protein n=1 Tax=Candidatus Sungbacteria bacterium RIFCSPLOWO2_12_FULL_41_11 TaxID=1802286 RepID=A0A1G2LRS6_9BACT|nr:MAG: hypothetical protein A3G49_05895 [Candidatus Sungbacteria bacterium RIFCSPLOWO2_12_FULL_41_11]